jgi:hypothetical protein
LERGDESDLRRQMQWLTAYFVRMFDNRISQRILERNSLEETRHAGKPTKGGERKCGWMPVICSVWKNGAQRQAVGLLEENGGAMASKLVDRPEEE